MKKKKLEKKSGVETGSEGQDKTYSETQGTIDNTKKAEEFKEFVHSLKISDKAKSQFLDKNGNVEPQTLSFFSIVGDIVGTMDLHVHKMFTDTLDNGESWDFLSDPGYYLKKGLAEYKTEYKTQILDKLSQTERESAQEVLPDRAITIIYKRRFVGIFNIMAEVYAIDDLKIRLYYEKHGVVEISKEEAISAVDHLFEELKEKVATLYSEVVKEAQDMVLDDYNAKVISKEMLGVIMEEMGRGLEQK